MSERIEHYKRGLTHFGQNEFTEAIECYNAALEEDADWVDVLHALAMSQMNSGEEGAEARMISWKDELKENPDAPPPAEPGSMNVVQ